MRRIQIADRLLGDGCLPFIVGEVGVNHNGSLDRALAMVGVAKEAGCDAVKFGTFKAAEFCAPDDPLFKMFQSCELEDAAWKIIKSEADRLGIIFFSTPQNRTDLDVLLKVGVPAVKVGSDDLTNLDLIRSYAGVGLPLILSTGMADERDVFNAVDAASSALLAVCVCTSEYPTPPQHANLARITTLREILPDVPIGFSDHTVGPMAACIAAGLGASYFEKHMTLDNTLSGPDHIFSANPAQLANWVLSIRTAHAMLGSGAIVPTEVERQNAPKWRRESGQKIRGMPA